MIHALVMAGGVGSRFWPKSRSNKPKQFLPLVGDKTLIRQTFERISPIVDKNNIVVITNQSYTGMVKDELQELTDHQIVGEIVGRNTAPCVALAAVMMQARDPEAVMVVLPSDHYISNEKEYISTIKAAAEKAKSGKNLVTVGIQPTRPETGYGYIQFDQPEKITDKHPVYLVKTFAEKPDLETAARFIASGDFLWNSGMFVWRADTILDEFQKYLPQMYDEVIKVIPHLGTENQAKAINEFYQSVISISIDYGIMEKTDAVHVIPGDFGWSDVGSWMAVYEQAGKDATGNVIKANDYVSINAQNCYVETSSNKLVGLVGVQGITLVETDDAILLCRSDASQDVKKLYDELDKQGRKDML